MNPQLILALVIAAAGFGSGFGSAWQIQDWRMDAKEKDYVEQKLAAERLSAAQAIRHAQALHDAQNAATARAAGLRRDADGVRTALVSLSSSAERALRDAAASQEACLDRASTFSELFLTSSDEYRKLAEKAGRHVNDIQTLSEGWPKESRQ